jgi:hypothetical protein
LVCIERQNPIKMQGSNFENMDDEIIVTRRMDGRRGVVIKKQQYEEVSNFILSLLRVREEMTLNELLEQAQRKVSPRFKEEYVWRMLQVKEDLQAQGVIKVTFRQDRTQYLQSLKERPKRLGRVRVFKAQ